MERQEFWNKVGDYDSEIRSLARQPGAPHLKRVIADQARSVRSAADAGCGPGNFLPELAKAQSLYAIDWSDNMLGKAREQAPSHTRFVKSDLRDVRLPEPVDLLLSLNSIMPESHGDAIHLVRNVTSLVRPGGVVIFVVPSFEGLLYEVNANHFEAAVEGEAKERESLRHQMASFVAHFNNPLGYIRSSREQVTKHWIAEEFEALVRHVCGPVSIDRFKVALEPSPGTETHSFSTSGQWHWGFVASLQNSNAPG